jgi:hypothetical protein
VITILDSAVCIALSYVWKLSVMILASVIAVIDTATTTSIMKTMSITSRVEGNKRVCIYYTSSNSRAVF